MLCTLKEHIYHINSLILFHVHALMTRHLNKFTLLRLTLDCRVGAGAPCQLDQLDNGDEYASQTRHKQQQICKSLNESKPSTCQNPARNTDLSDSTNRMTLWATDWTIESPIFMAILFLNKGEQLQVNKQGEQSKTFKREKQHKKHYVKINWSSQ